MKYHYLKKLPHSAWQQRRRIASVFTVLALASFGVQLGNSRAESDNIAPQLVGMSVSTPTFEVDQNGPGVVVHFNITDNLSGFFYGDVIYTSPSGKQIANGSISSQAVDTNQYDGVANFNGYMEAGVWQPTITLIDNSGNTKVYTSSDIAGLGISADITVTGGPSDTQAPVLTSFSLNQSSFDTATNGAAVFATMHFSDDLSGPGIGKVDIISPTGKQVRTFDLFAPDTEGNQQAAGTIEQYAETGTWRMRVTVRDNTGNTAIYDSTDIANAGFSPYFTVTGNGDTTPPTVTDISFNVADPVIDEVPFGGGAITLHAHFADNLSGYQAAVLSYVSPNGNQTSSNTFSVDNTGFGTTTIYLPSYASSGQWKPTLTLYDSVGNIGVYDDTALTGMGLPLHFAIAKNITSAVSAGGTVTSDTENDGATTTDPVEASVTSPIDGNISIVMIDSDSITSQTNGYSFFGRQISISAPVATVADPLTLTFRIDASKIPVGQSAATLQITKNGVTLPACVDGVTADPDACVFSRTTLGDGDIQVQIHSTTASVWNSGFPTNAGFTFRGFLSPVKNPPVLNKVEAESTVPIKFDLGGNFGLNVLETGYPLSQKINCTTLAPIGNATKTHSTNSQGLKYKDGNGIYRYEWRTLESWENTCRKFTLKLSDGTVHTANFKFKDD